MLAWIPISIIVLANAVAPASSRSSAGNAGIANGEVRSRIKSFSRRANAAFFTSAQLVSFARLDSPSAGSRMAGPALGAWPSQ